MTQQSDGKVSVTQGMQSTPSLPSFLGPLWPGVVAPERVLSMGQKELKCVLMLTELFKIQRFLYAKLNCMKVN